MNNPINHAAEAAGCTAAQASAIAGAFAACLRERCAQFDSVAIPGFGSFATEKTDEHVDTDPATGRTMLMPPHISLGFHPGSMLRKHLSTHE